MRTVGILVVLFGGHILGVGLHVLGILAFLVRCLFAGSALLAVYIAALGVAVLGGIAHIVHAIFVFHDFHPLYVGKGSLCRKRGNMRKNFFRFGSGFHHRAILHTTFLPACAGMFFAVGVDGWL